MPKTMTMEKEAIPRPDRKCARFVINFLLGNRWCIAIYNGGGGVSNWDRLEFNKGFSNGTNGI